MSVANIDFDALHSLVLQEPLAIAGKAFGDAGTARMKGILRFLKASARFATVNESSDVTVFSLIQNDPIVDALRLSNASAFVSGTSAHGTVQQLCVEIREDNSAFIWPAIPSQAQAVIETGLVYRLRQSVETFSINGAVTPIPKVIQGSISQFWINYFVDLKDALKAYNNSMARTSKCHLLRKAWAEDKRLWFDTKPEFRLRQALHNYLYSFLRHDDIDLREEQNVDSSHPVDIKIVWRMENRSAIIEVKWIGKSINLVTRKITASYTNARAQKGAKQLAEYLEWHRQQAASEDTRGYLVVFDCRRKGLKPSNTSITHNDGCHFLSKDLSFNPEYNQTRTDFEEPIRMFLEPVVV